LTHALVAVYGSAMVLNLEQASHAVLRLSIKERAALAHALIQSLDAEVETNLESAWEHEISHRLNRIERGETTERDAFEVLDAIRLKHDQAS
jgi:putative addiction module component (TIGR02574 family)